MYRRHEAWQNVIAWFLRRSGIGIMGSAYGTPPTCKGIFSMAAAQATGWHAMGESAADDFRKEDKFKEIKNWTSQDWRQDRGGAWVAWVTKEESSTRC